MMEEKLLGSVYEFKFNLNPKHVIENPKYV
jgi:hypothetical protein